MYLPKLLTYGFKVYFTKLYNFFFRVALDGPQANAAPLLPLNCMKTPVTFFPSREQALTLWPKNGNILELGTETGNFAKLILEQAEPRELTLIDITFDFFIESNLLGNQHKVIKKHGDSVEQLTVLENNYFDVIYIDADHSYVGVKRDAIAAVSKLKKGGLLVFNDYTHFDPIHCIPFGIPKAVHEIMREHDCFEIAYFALHPLGFHDIALRKL